MTGCATCDRHGPEVPGSWNAWLDLHRVLHDLARALAAPIVRLLGRPR